MNLREYGREGNLETSAPSLTGIFYMQGEEYSMKKSGVLGLAVLLALAGGTAHAAGVYELEGVVVTATKIEESTEKVPASISVVTAKEIKDRGYQSVAQALGQEPGVYLSPVANGGISLRGFASSDILVLVDGQPVNSGWNGSVDWTMIPVENIKKIAYLRTLGISIEDIRSIISGKVTLQETLERQNEILNSQITDLNKAKLMCEKMLGEESISYEKLQVEQYVTELQDYWKDNQTVFKLDSVSFLYIWGSMLTWITITVLCLIIGALSYSKLPTEIPVQWSKGVATSLVNKNWIFICPVICIIIRYLLKPFIYAKLQMNNFYGEIITEYLTNYMCFIVLSVEIFSILFTFGVVKSVVVLLFVNTAVFMGLLVVGLTKMDLRGKEIL